jgi:SAM-dependent methyltransferase
MPLFRSHLDFTHRWWRDLLSSDDCVVDATCGNGHDTLFLAALGCQVLACDLQEAAVAATRQRVAAFPNVEVRQACHAELAETINPCSLKLVAFNLGYLPGGGNKQLTTKAETTLLALNRFLPTLIPNGVLCVTCYPGHLEGAREERMVLDWAASLPARWGVSHHRWLTSSPNPPSVLLLQNRETRYHRGGTP